MKDCLTASAEHAPLVPNKRVKYTFGMVLGEKDFRQEQVHFEWKHQISNLLLHGYGTVCGLKVTARAVTNPSDVEVRISAGYGISPYGKWMWVEHDQCARLGEWLQKHRLERSPLPGPGRETLYVKLCYVECPTNVVPIAGQACASDEDTCAPSRIHEAFQAKFSWQSPDQRAETLYRKFGELLEKVEILSELESPVASDDSESFLKRVQELGEETSPPLASPLEAERFRLAEQTACETIRQALVIWVTEVCPRIQPDLKQDTNDCILLARIEFSTNANGDLIPGSIHIADDERPVLVSDRLKQELFCLMGRGETGGRVDHGVLDGLLDDDHPQYLLTNGGRALTGDLSAGGNHITNLAEAGANGQAVRYEQAVKVGDAPIGDLSGLFPNPTVAGLRGREIANIPPANAQVLTWVASERSGRWEPRDAATGVTDHGALNGREDDDHLQYLNNDRGDARYAPLGHNHSLDNLSDVNAPGPGDGQVLTWNQEAGQAGLWEPQTVSAGGNFVQVPALAGPYAIVAAGFFDSQGRQQGPVYNNLAAIGPNSRGEYQLRFSGYRQPLEERNSMYIVKGTVQDDPGEESRRATFQFVRFEPDHILVRVLAVNNELIQAGFMVEISMFGEIPPGL